MTALDRQARLAISESADFHDREDFSTLCRIKVFAIMKLSLLSSDLRACKEQ
jgi:hypothetical protein